MGRRMMPVFVPMPQQYTRRCASDPLEDLINSALYGMLTPDGRDMTERCVNIPGCQKKCEPKEHCGTKEGCSPRRSPSPFPSLFRILVPRQPWIQLVDVSGFGPNDLSVKVEEGKFIVHARREIKLKDGDFELIERRRSVKIPESVDTSAISCHLRPDGKLVVRAPYVEEEPSAKQEDREKCCCEKKECKKEESNGENSGKKEENEMSEVSSKDNECVEQCDDEQTCVLGTCEKKPIDKEETEEVKAKEESEEVTCQQKSEDETNEKAPSPVPSDDFCVLEGILLPDEGEQSENTEEADVMETNVDQKMFPFTDNVRVVETEDKKHYEVKVNLAGFQPDDISVKCVDDELILDSRREWETTEGVESVQAFHRRYTLPQGALCDKAKAVLNDSGLMVITVPIVEREAGNAVHVPVMPAEE